MNKLLWSFCLVFALASVSYGQFDYQKVVKKYIENQLKTGPCSIDRDFKDFKKWQVMNYPVNNYGLLTLYDRQADGSYSLLEDMWSTLRYADSEVPNDFTLWIRMDGFAAPGINGPTINITGDSDKKKFGFGFLFPKLLSAIGVSAAFDKDRTTVVDLQIESFIPRCLRRPTANRFLNGAEAEPQNQRRVDPTIAGHFAAGDLAIVVGDVIAKNMTITVTADVNTTASIEAKIGADVTNKVFQDADLKFNYLRQQKGKYTFTVTSPVVVARLIKSQPSGGTSGDTEFFENYIAVDARKIPLPK